MPFRARHTGRESWQRDDSRPGRTEPLQKPADEQHFEPARREGEQRAGKKQARPNMICRFAPGAVGHWTVEQLAKAEGQGKSGQNQLAIIGASATFSSAAISASAGSIELIDSATSDMRSAISATKFAGRFH